MKINDFQTQVVPVCKKAENDGDGVFFLHFSAEEDKFQGGELGLDSLDIGLVVRQFFTRVVTEVTKKTKPGFIAFGIFSEIKKECEDLMEQCLLDSEPEKLI